jgi:hypothetical protein
MADSAMLNEGPRPGVGVPYEIAAADMPMPAWLRIIGANARDGLAVWGVLLLLLVAGVSSLAVLAFYKQASHANQRVQVLAELQKSLDLMADGLRRGDDFARSDSEATRRAWEQLFAEIPARATPSWIDRPQPADPLPRRDPQPEPRRDPQPEPQPEPRRDPQPEPHPEPRRDPQPEPQPEPRRDPQPEPRRDPQPEPQPEPQPLDPVPPAGRGIFGQTIAEQEVVWIVDASDAMQSSWGKVTSELERVFSAMDDTQRFTIHFSSEMTRSFSKSLVAANERFRGLVLKFLRMQKPSGSPRLADALAIAATTEGAKAIVVITSGTLDDESFRALRDLIEQSKTQRNKPRVYLASMARSARAEQLEQLNERKAR